jgi:serine phosphatase RsbU (regulator of sigma subunit)/anti-sigma regulatory factor (Ser/Thr protein kinase)
VAATLVALAHAEAPGGGTGADNAPAPAPPDPSASTSILLVDDDQNSLRALQEVLRPLGQRLVAVSSGEAALRCLLQQEFAVILLDMRMPSLDGLETARYINARSRTRHIPIIFLTAHSADMEQVFRAYAAGAVDYVVKPCDPDVLRSKVAVFVELHRERSERVRQAQALAEAEAIASTLQRHLLPDGLPEVPALQMAARYSPGERAAQVGGDWYDAIVLPGGHVGLAIGDVVGHGVRAATLMGELRSALRAYAISEPDSPAAALTRLNSLVARTHGGQMVATALYMVIDTDGRHLRFASAGHLPPLLLDAEGDARFLESAPMPPLGIAWHTSSDVGDAELAPGSTVLLYTDGLVERRGEQIDDGLARLRTAMSEGPASLEALCSHVLSRTPGQAELQDDVALLAVKLLESSAERLEVDLPAEPESVSIARHRLQRWLSDTGEGRDDVLAIKLAVSEVCANAVEHAYGPESGHTFHLLAERADTGAVVVQVSDSGHWRPRRGAQRGLGLRMIDELMDAVEIERTATGTMVRMRKQPSDDEQR